MYDVIKANFFHYVDQYSCTLNALDNHIQAECSCDSIAVMFQMIVQASNHSKVYSNRSMDPHTPVTVEVERDGLYQVTIFPIREGRGILESSMEVHYYNVTIIHHVTSTFTQGMFSFFVIDITEFSTENSSLATTTVVSSHTILPSLVILVTSKYSTCST